MIEPLFSASLALIAAICWGANSHIVKKGMIGQDPMIGMAIRSMATFPILTLIVLFWKGKSGILVYFESEILPIVIFTSVLIIIGDGLFMFALKNYPVNLMLPIASIYPLFTTIILLFTGTEEIGVFVVIGTVVIISGVVVVTKGDGSSPVSYQALSLGILASMCWGSSIFFVRKILEFDNTESMGLTGIRTLYMGIGAMIFYYLMPKNERDLEWATKEEKLRSIKYLALSGIIGWVLGASIFFLAIQNIGAAIPTPISSTNPIIASIIGYYLGIEVLSKRKFIGILLSVTGTILILL
ncbi:MAG: DMT family transporter [Candidatus Kariarchaeaceae archaeon]